MSSAILKKLSAAAAILVIAWIIYVYRQVPHQKTPFAKAADKTEEIVLEQAGRRVNLRRESGLWKVSAGSDSVHPADAELVKPLLSGLKNLQIEDEISDRPDRAADYDLTAENGIRIRLLSPQKASLAEGIFGKQSPDYGHLYFRYSDKPNVYLARGLMRGDLGRLEVNYWRSRQLVDIPETKIQSISIEGKGFKSELVRISTDVWTLNGQPVDPAPVNALVGALAHLRAEDFVDPAANPMLTENSLTFARVALKGAGSSAVLRFGPEDGKSKRYPVSVGPDSGLAWLPESSAKAILKKPSDFKTRQ